MSNLRWLNRRIADCSLYSVTGYCESQYYSSAYKYIFGRREGTPPRGPNPTASYFGTTDTDDAYNAVPTVLSYWQNTFSRNGANFLGGNTNNYPSPDPLDRLWVQTYLDSVWGHSCTGAAANVVGTIGFCRGMLVPSVTGHEMQHVINNFAFRNANGHALGITYFGESGAIDESYADLFGERMKTNILGITDWVAASDAPVGIGRRSFSDPTAQGFPDRFYSPFYDCGDGSYTIDQNLSVLNKAWYLMVEGGSFNGCTIQGTQREKVELMAYKALNTYFTQTMSFNAAYDALLRACPEVATSSECAEIKKALQAVELDQPGICSGQPRRLPECADACPSDPDKTEPGICGCGIADTDGDGDGTVDCKDQCPTDSFKLTPGHCGCGNTDDSCNWCEDSDGGNIPSKRGTVETNTMSYPDTCLNNKIVLESYCVSGMRKQSYSTCVIGCSAGACLGG